MRREANRGENRGLFNEACHPKPPSSSHPTPSSSIPSSFRPSSSSRVLSLHLSLPLFLHFVAFICLSSLLLSHPIICTPPPTPLPFLLLLISCTQFLFILISPPFHQTVFTSLSSITFESSHYFVGTANEKQ